VCADHSGSEMEGMKCLARLNTGIMGSNPTRGAGVRVFSVFMLSRVGSGLATGLITHAVNPTDCKINSSRLILTGNRPQSLTRQENEDALINVYPKFKKNNHLFTEEL
jgi:hypothetical protein